MEYIEEKDDGSGISTKEVVEELDVSRPTASKHLNRLENEDKIAFKEVANKKFWMSESSRVKDSELDDEKILEAIEVVKQRLDGLRDPTITEVAAEMGKNEESKSFRKKFKEVARSNGWASPKEERHEDIRDLLKTVVVMEEDFKRSPSYPTKKELKPRDRANEYASKNRDIIDKIEVEKVDEASRNDLYRAKLPYELKIITGKEELIFSAF